MVPVPADGQDALMDAALFRRPPDRFVDVGEGAVAVRTVGSGPDVVLVHGWPVSGATWRRLLPHLTPHVTCHVLDLVGAGDSRFDRSSRLDLDLHVRSVRAVVDDLGTDVAVVGHDSGGLIARHAVVGLERLRGLGLVATEQLRPAPLFRAFVATGRLPGFAAVFGRLVVARRLRRSPLVLGGAFHDKALLDGEFDELLLRPLHDDADKRWAAGQLVRSFDMALVRDLPQVHAAIPAPVQLVWGDGDPFFPVDRAREMVPSFPDAQLTVVPQARLFVHEERPEQVAAALLPVLLGTRRAAA
jgi:haloalkane dehalogenase